jgi:TatD DNase family protein
MAGGESRDTRPPLPEPLPHPVVDNHCHLDMSAARDGTPLEVDEALRLSASVGVPRIVQIGCDLAGARWAVQTAQRYNGIVAGVALHPNEAPRLADKGFLDDALAEIDRLAGSSDRVRAVGETGLDYYRTEPEGRDAQHASFRAHIALAKRHAKTLVVHDRDAHDDVLHILDQEGHPERVVMHCFSGDADFARACAERGFWLSYAGTVTFKNAEPLREALAVTPLYRLLVETDAPFLTPMPYRGRPNASYLVPLTVRAMADTLAVDVGDLCRRIDANTEAAFGGSW